MCCGFVFVVWYGPACWSFVEDEPSSFPIGTGNIEIDGVGGICCKGKQDRTMWEIEYWDLVSRRKEENTR